MFRRSLGFIAQVIAVDAIKPIAICTIKTINFVSYAFLVYGNIFTFAKYFRLSHQA